MTIKHVLAAAICLAPISAVAQTVPALDAPIATAPGAVSTPAVPNRAPPPVPLLSARQATLTPAEKRGVAVAKTWTGNNLAPSHGQNGAVVFDFGATLPSVVCAPFKVCVLKLEPGETVNVLAVGDNGRWVITPASTGEGAERATLVLIKPADIGLETNLVITTDKRVYNMKLVSRATDWMPFAEFRYPEAMKAQWDAYIANEQMAKNAARAQRAAYQQAAVLPTGEVLQNLDFGFRVSGDQPSWKPLRVYSDGSKTYIELPPGVKKGEAPVLVGLGADKQVELINYRSVGNRLIVDQVIDRAALLSGVGKHQTKVEITRAARG